MLGVDEKWIYGYEGRYSASKDGIIYSHNFSNTGIKKPLVNSPDNRGYCRITLRKDRKVKTVKVHRLIMETFSIINEDKECINHIDGDKSNNKLDNLEWCTHKENTNHAWDNKLCISRNGKHRDNILQILDGIIVGEYNGINDASISTGLHKSNISDVCNNGRQVTCGGYEWMYKEDYIENNKCQNI